MKEQKRSWIDWRVFVIVLAVLVLLPLFAWLLQSAVQPGVARAGTYRACIRSTATMKQNGKLFGIDTGKTVYWAAMGFDACANRREIVSYSTGPAVYGGVAALGQFFGFHYDGVVGGSGPKLGCNNGVCTGVTVKRIVQYSRAVPTPIGQIPNGTWRYRLTLTIFANGGQPYAWAGWKRI